MWLFARLHPATALALAIIGGYLLLPGNVGFNLPALPTINKASLPALGAWAAAAMFVQTRPSLPNRLQSVLPGMVPRSRVALILIVLMLAGVLGTVATNGDAVHYPAKRLPGLRLYDVGSLGLNAFMMLLPFLLARKYLAAPETHSRLLVVLAISGLIYSLLALYEVRMSPQLSSKIYGYFPHSWRQHIRAGGYRPVVFLSHGLWLAIFFCGSFLATLSLWRMTQGAQRIRWMIAAAWLAMVLVLSKGLGALAIGIMLATVIVFLPVRLRIMTAAIFAGIILFYPMLRGADMIPTERVLNFAANIDTVRAGSLEFRFDNEDILLAKANQRPLFGWGGWGRNRVFDETGADISVTDGYWVMAIGTGGWIGYLAQLGLLTLPLIFLALRWRGLELTPATAGVALALTANLIDLIPNATLTPVTWLMAGALAGRLEMGRIVAPAAQADAVAVSLRREPNPYTRQPQRHPTRSPRHPVQARSANLSAAPPAPSSSRPT